MPFKYLVYKSVNGLSFHCELSATFTKNTIKTWTELTQYIHVKFLWHTVLNFGSSHYLILTSLCFMQRAHWGCVICCCNASCCRAKISWCIQITHTCLSLNYGCFVPKKSELKIRGSVRAAIWRSATVQQQGSSTPGPTTGCFWLNKDFLLSSEVPTDAFIGAKFTLCARRKLPLFGLKVQLTYVSALLGGFSQ